MSGYSNNSIFWVETEKILPNPFQPRREFDEKALEDLADSIRQYGVLQPLVVTRKEIILPDNNGMDVQYELIAGERRLRASKIAGLQQVPVIIRKETDNKVKLELAIIENLQREDLNPIDRARAFEQLHKEFGLTHVEIGKRMGKSRVYVSNSLRLLALPEEIKQGLMEGRITEGHTRPLLMLIDRPAEQNTLYKEIMVKKLSVRDAEKVARKIAQERVRKKEFIVDPKIREFEKKLSEKLGTRVHIEPKENGGQITIDYFTVKDLEEIISSMKKVQQESSMMESYLENKQMHEKQDLERSTGLSFQSSSVSPEPTEISTVDVDTVVPEDDSLQDIPQSETKDSLPEEDHSLGREIPAGVASEISYPHEESLVRELPKEAMDEKYEDQNNRASDPYREDISNEPTELPSAESMLNDELVRPDDVNPSMPNTPSLSDAPHSQEDNMESRQDLSSPETIVLEDDQSNLASSPPSHTSYDSYQAQEFPQTPVTDNNFPPVAEFSPVQEETTRSPQSLGADTQTYPPAGDVQASLQAGSQDAYYNPQYYPQHSQAQATPKKKSFLGKLFG